MPAAQASPFRATGTFSAAVVARSRLAESSGEAWSLYTSLLLGWCFNFYARRMSAKMRGGSSTGGDNPRPMSPGEPRSEELRNERSVMTPPAACGASLETNVGFPGCLPPRITKIIFCFIGVCE